MKKNYRGSGPRLEKRAKEANVPHLDGEGECVVDGKSLTVGGGLKGEGKAAGGTLVAIQKRGGERTNHFIVGSRDPRRFWTKKNHIDHRGGGNKSKNNKGEGGGRKGRGGEKYLFYRGCQAEGGSFGPKEEKTKETRGRIRRRGSKGGVERVQKTGGPTGKPWFITNWMEWKNPSGQACWMQDKNLYSKMTWWGKVWAKGGKRGTKPAMGDKERSMSRKKIWTRAKRKGEKKAFCPKRKRW